MNEKKISDPETLEAIRKMLKYYVDNASKYASMTRSNVVESINWSIAGTVPKLLNYPATYAMHASQGLLAHNCGGYAWIPSVVERLDHSLSSAATNYFVDQQQNQDKAQEYKKTAGYREKKKQWKEVKSLRGQRYKDDVVVSYCGDDGVVRSE